MEKIKVQIDTVKYDEKPKEAIGTIKARTQNNKTIQEITLNDLIEKIKQGYSFSPGVLVNGCGADNWKEQRLLFVDIDNDRKDKNEECLPFMNIDEALKICADNNLNPIFYYYSFRHTKEHPKYRIAFMMDELITDTDARAIIMDTLIALFPQSDLSGANADRFFFGTNKELIVRDLEARITMEDIYQANSIIVSKKANEKVNKIVKNDNELTALKQRFDFYGYLKERNGKELKNNSKYVMFEKCEICGHSKDLVYYHDTKMFKCFGGNGGKSGSIIDYLMATDNLTLNQAIDKFKYEIMGLERKTVIKRPITDNEELFNILKEKQPHTNYSQDDKGLGELFADVYKDKCRYNTTAKEWYVYNGKIWDIDTGGLQVSRYAKELADSLYKYATTIENDRDKVDYIKFIVKLGQLNNRRTMIDDSRDKYCISNKDLDKNLYLFNCQNGTLDLNTFEFKPHDHNDLLSKISNVYYDKSIKSDDFADFISKIMQNDAEKISYLQKIFGYSLTGDTRLEQMWILYGATTRNGKSTLVETIAYMMGNTSGYALTMKPETLAQKQNNDSRQASGDIARLNGCRFLNASEPPKRMMFDVGLIKTLLGRDSITARHLHEREFEFIPIFKLFMNTNFLPLITDETLFTSGRIQVITFDRHFSQDEQDKTLKTRLKEKDNISGIFNWCIEGLKLFNDESADPPEAITKATEEYRQNSDKIGNFMLECLEKSDNNSTAKEIYEVYCKWCEENGYGTENKGNFFAELRTKNIFKDAGTVKGATVRNIVVGYEIRVDILQKYYEFRSFK